MFTLEALKAFQILFSGLMLGVGLYLMIFDIRPRIIVQVVLGIFFIVNTLIFYIFGEFGLAVWFAGLSGYEVSFVINRTLIGVVLKSGKESSD